MSSEPVVAATNLSKAYLIYERPEDRLKQMLWGRRKQFYQEYWAVRDVSFRIERGETVGIIGRNGSGKSTLLKVLAGILEPTSGSADIRGRVAPLLELGAGFNPEFTGRENVTLSASLMGLTEAEIAERFDDILAFAALGDFVEQPVRSYSSGMFARLAFAVAAHVDPDVLIVDEVLSVGDAAFHQKCMRYIQRFKENGTLLFVSHDTVSVNALCDRAIWMDQGSVRADGDARDVNFAYQASLQEETDGEGFSVQERQRRTPPVRLTQPQLQDARHTAMKTSGKRNTIEVFAFSDETPAYGLSGGRITGAQLLAGNGSEGKASAVLDGGEEVTLQVDLQADIPLNTPIVGFFVRDKRGQNLFGDNTFLTYADQHVSIPSGASFEARFQFLMPYLPSGDYFVTIALAEGTQIDHVQHHWLEEALTFHVDGGHVAQGLIGIPMHSIEMAVRS